MIVKEGRSGGRTTQTFCEILVSDQDVILWCKDPSYVKTMFISLFPTFVKATRRNSIQLIDNRIVAFEKPIYSNYKKVLGFQGEMKTEHN